MDNFPFSSQGLPGNVGAQAQATVGFLNSGGASRAFDEWNTLCQDHISKTKKGLETLDSRTDRTQKPIPAERINAVRDLIPLLQAQASVIERSFELIDQPDAWQEQDLAQAKDFSENRLPKGHALVKRLRERWEIEIAIEQMEELLRTNRASDDEPALLDRWDRLFQVHMQKSRSPTPSPALLRSRDLLIVTWGAAINAIIVKAKDLLQNPSWSDVDRAQAQTFESAIDIAEGRLAKLTKNTDTAFVETFLVRQHLNDRLKNRSTTPMSDNSKKTAHGNPTGGNQPPAPPAPPQADPPPVPPVTPAGGPLSDEHNAMVHYTNTAFGTVKDLERVAALAKPLLNGSRQPENEIEKNFLERVERFITEVVDPLIEQTKVAGRITRDELNRAIKNRELLLCAVEQFRGPEAAKQASDCLVKEALSLNIERLLQPSEGSWNNHDLADAQDLSTHPQLQGTAKKQELDERIALEMRIIDAKDRAAELLSKNSWTANEIERAQSLLAGGLLKNAGVIESLQRRLTPPTKTPAPPPPPKPKTTDTVIFSKDAEPIDPWWKQSWVKYSAMAAAALLIIVGMALITKPIMQRWQRSHANQAALAAAAPTAPTAPPAPPPVDEPIPQTDEPAPAEPPAPGAEPVAAVSAPAPAVTPTNEVLAPSPANPPAEEPAPAVTNAATERALTRADFGGHPINRVPDDAQPRGSWIGRHLRCSTPPIANNNGFTDYRTCRFVP